MDARDPRHHRLPERALRALCLSGVAALVASSTACTRDQLVYHATLPGTSSSASIEFLGERAGYLDVRIETAGKRLRFLLDAASESCAGLREATGELAYTNSGLLGRLDSGSLRCEPVGVLSLVEWRSRRARGSREPIPRARSTWSVIHRDADLVLARGRFPLAGQLGWVGGVDTVAVFAVDPACDSTLERGVGSLEYRHAGPDVLALVGDGRLCPLLGIARPLPPRR